jgi:hypothetical protein
VIGEVVAEPVLRMPGVDLSLDAAVQAFTGAER